LLQALLLLIVSISAAPIIADRETTLYHLVMTNAALGDPDKTIDLIAAPANQMDYRAPVQPMCDSHFLLVRHRDQPSQPIYFYGFDEKNGVEDRDTLITSAVGTPTHPVYCSRIKR
jgi:hypothetical protein